MWFTRTLWASHAISRTILVVYIRSWSQCPHLWVLTTNDLAGLAGWLASLQTSLAISLAKCVPADISTSFGLLTVKQTLFGVVETSAQVTCLLLVQSVQSCFTCGSLFSDFVESGLLATLFTTSELLLIVVLGSVNSELLLSTSAKFTVFTGAIDDLLAVELFWPQLLVILSVRLGQVGFEGWLRRIV